MADLPPQLKDRLLEDLLKISDKPTQEEIERFNQNFAVFDRVLSEDPEIISKVRVKRCDLRDLPLPNGDSGLFGFLSLLRQKNITSFELCTTELKNAINELSKTRTKKYTFIFALNFKSNNEVGSAIDGQRFCLYSSLQSISDLIDVDGFLNYEHPPDTAPGNRAFISNHIKKSIDANYSYFAADVYARSFLFADEFIHEKLLYFLGLLQLSKRCPPSFPPFKELSHLSIQYDIMLRESSHPSTYPFRYTTSDLESFTNDELKAFVGYLDACKKMHPSIAAKVFDASKSFYEASTEPDVAHSFFKYWICIESCLKSDSVFEKEIANRLKKVIRHSDPYSDWRIDSNLAKRNKFVHELKMDISVAQRDSACLLAQTSIIWLLAQGMKFSNAYELELFYKYVQEDKVSLETHAKMIQKALATYHDCKKEQ
jgi:hypothetical protein